MFLKQTNPHYKLFLFLAAFLALSGIASADTNLSACANLSTANENYTLNTSVSINGSTCFNISAENVTINCAGYSITGNNTSNTYGIYSNQNNTTIQNCVVSDFDISIDFDSAINGTVSNTTASSAIHNGRGICLESGSNSNTVFNSTVTAGSGIGILIYGQNNNINQLVASGGYEAIYISANNNTVANSTATGLGGIGIILASSYNNIHNVTATSNSDKGLQISSYTSNTITNSTLISTSSYALYLYRSSSSMIANCTIRSNNTAIYIDLDPSVGIGSTRNTIYNNTLISGSGASNMLYVSANSTNNTFYWNNFSATTGIYVNDTNGSNYYNTTLNSSGAGNIWANVINQSVQVLGNLTSPFTSLNYGSAGSGYPYNNSTSDGKLIGNVVDNGPLTPQVIASCTDLSSSGQTYVVTSNLAVNGSTCFNVTAENITIDCAGYSVTGNNTTDTYGVYSDQFNTTITNCNITNFDTGIYFNAADNGTISNTNITITKENYADPTYCAGINLYNGANYNSISNVNASTVFGNGIIIHSNSIYNTIADSAIVSTTKTGIYTYTGSNYTTVTNTYAFGGELALYFTNIHNSTVSSCTMETTSTYGAFMIRNANDNTIANNTMNGSGVEAIEFNGADPCINNLFYNNTLISNTTLLLVNAQSTNNTFCWNNFTNTSGYYVNDANGGNYYNSSTCSNEGNIWFNVMNGSVDINGTSNSTGFPSLYIGVGGSGYPYNNSTAQNKLLGIIVDYAPLTSNGSTDLSCTNLSEAGTTYNMTASASANGSTCFTVTAENVTLNCAGYSVTGNNTTDTYGVYSDQFNTTITNCEISNFQHAIYFSGSDNGTISSTNASTTYDSAYGIYITGSDYNTISNSKGSTITGRGMRVTGSHNTISSSTAIGTGTAGRGLELDTCDNTTITGLNATSVSSYGIIMQSSSDNSISDSITASTTSHGIYIASGTGNTINNLTGTSSTNYGIFLSSSNLNTIENSSSVSATNYALMLNAANNNTIRNTTGIGGKAGLWLYDSENDSFDNCSFSADSTYAAILVNAASNNVIANSTITGTDVEAIEFYALGSPCTGNIFYNNTLFSTGDAILLTTTKGGENTFCWNNFTNTSGYYVNDSNGTNYYNSSICSNEGNIWHNVMNGSVSITGTNNSTGFPSLYIGTGGSGYPYNNSTAQEKLLGIIVDYAPLASQPGAASLFITYANYTDPDQFYSPFSGNDVININATANSSGYDISYITANMTTWPDNATVFSINMTYNNSTTHWNASINISSYLAELVTNGTLNQTNPVIAYTIYIYPTNTNNTTNTSIGPDNNIGVLLHDLGSFQGPPEQGNISNCFRESNDSTNMSQVLNFNAVNLIQSMELNGSAECHMQFAGVNHSLPWGSTFKKAGKMNFTSVDISTEAKASAVMSAMGNLIQMQISPPHSFQPSRIFVNTTNFSALNTSAVVTMYDLPFGSAPQVIADNGSDITNMTWSQGPFNSTYNSSTGNLTIYLTGFSGYNISDNNTPNISILTPTQALNTTDTTLTVNVSANGTGTEISYLSINITNATANYTYIYSNTTNTANCSQLSNGSENITCQINVSLAEGNWSINATARDYGGSSPGNLHSTKHNFTIYSSTANISACANLSIAGRSYTLNQSVSITGATCFNISAENITLNCNGYSVTGNNATSTWGIYSTNNRTIIRNCVVSSFSTGIFFNGTDYGSINNSTVTITHTGLSNDVQGRGIMLYGSANYNNVTNCTATTTSTPGINLDFNSFYNTIERFVGFSTTGNSLRLYANSSHNTIANSTVSVPEGHSVGIYDSSYINIINLTTVSSSTGVGIIFSGSNYTNITNSTATANLNTAFSISTGIGVKVLNNTFTSSSSHALYSIYPYNCSIIDNILQASGSSAALYMREGVGNNATKNTITATTGTAVQMQNSNTTRVLENNITGPVWISNSGTGNVFNNSSLGNIYYLNNSTPSWHIFDIIDFTGDNWADYGTDRPFNNSTVSGNWTGTGEDYKPYTTTNTVTTCINVSTAGHTITLGSNVSITGATCFNIQATNITLDCNGYTITGNNTSDTYGIYSNQFNATIANCNILNFSHGIYFDTLDYGTIENTNSSTTKASSYGIYLNNGAEYNNIRNSRGTSTQSRGISLETNSNHNILVNLTATSSTTQSMRIQNSDYNTIINCTGNSNPGVAIFLDSADYNNVINSQGFSMGNSGLALSSSSNNNITNYTATVTAAGRAVVISGSYNTLVNVTVTSNSGKAFYLFSAANNTIENCTGMSNTDYAIYIRSGSNSTNIINSTLTSNTSTAIYIDSGSSNNTFLTNNISGVKWVDNSGTGNVFNNSTHGNIYYFNNSTPSWHIFDIRDEDGDHWADAGSDRPFNNSTVTGNWTGPGQDYHPYVIAGAIGNGSNISTNGTGNLTVSIANNTTINGESFEGNLSVNISSNNTTLVYFNFNFSNSSINFSQINITNGTSGGASYFTFSSLPSGGMIGAKTLYLYGTSSDYNSVCIKDQENVTVSQISSACTGANEVIVTCDGTATSGYTCTRSGTTLTITGLNHSAVLQLQVSTPVTPTGSNTGGGSTGGGSAPPTQTTDEYEVDIGNGNYCTVSIKREIASTDLLSVLTTTLENIEENCTLEDYVFADTIPTSFSPMSEIEFSPVYSLSEGREVQFSFPIFSSGESKTITYSVSSWVPPSRVEDFTTYSMTAKKEQAAVPEIPEEETEEQEEELPEEEPEVQPEITPKEEPAIAEPEQEESTGLLSGISLAVILLAILIVIGAVYFLLAKGRKKP